MNRKIGSLLFTLVLGFIFYYLFLPALNLTSPGFWWFLFLLVVFYLVSYFANIKPSNIIIRKRVKLETFATIFLSSCMGIFALIFLVNFFNTPLFNAKGYSNRISVVEDSDFVTDIKEVDFSKIPLLDKDSSSKLGDRKMGQATDWVSQYYVSDLYTQINYNNEIIRVTPIEYADIIKYFTNRNEGIKGYISVNSVNGDASLVTLDNGLKYMPSAYFNENLSRKLRFSYPTLIFDEATFEIDNDGKPYWIVPYINYHGVGLRKEIGGVVILDPVSGESNKYSVEDVPTWVDHVYPSSLIIEELDDWGEYKNGFLNSIFGQKDVVNTTDGYNYIIIDDDVYLYTGVTSVSSDESNLGFVLTNLRTKETKYYSAPGVEEYSAMASAKGLVQEKGYDATFPLLINLNNRPTYLMSLKDDAGLVKMYAFVDVEDYQKVVTSDASLGINIAAEKYVKEVNFGNTSSVLVEDTIKVKSITSAIIDGNSLYYITDSNNKKYSVNIKVNKDLIPFIISGDEVSISYKEGNINNIESIDEVK